MLLADGWPSTPADYWTLGVYVLVVVGVPLVGFILMVSDVRAHYRRLKRALVLVSNYTVQIPAWVAHESRRRQRTPKCLAAFDLKLPCSESDLLHAYRQRVKNEHPDLGGDRNAFLRLQRDFEEARTLLESLRNA
ncbi:hypothetical protein Pan181_48660 [Aeoliella mucimassa]|uniref:DnaJ domain protein n=2 Tax=Aeoliella mucimassa TaxID=2527972 RepID=A0A518AV69_9BACT|nr:hypothetical protein Pan181_48660 [Aeoliella mucimassa]